MPILYLEPVPKGIGKSQLIEFLHRAGGIAMQQIGRIQIEAQRAAVEVPERLIGRLIQSLNGQALAGRRMRAWVTPPAASQGSESHFGRLLRLMDLEARAEAGQAMERIGRLSAGDAEKAGGSLIDLAIEDESAGLGGRVVLTLVKRNRTLSLPWTRLGVGSPVLLSEQSLPEAGIRGVISERGTRSIRIAVAEHRDEFTEGSSWRIDLSSDEVTRDRQRAALQRAETAGAGRLAELRKLLLGERPPRFEPLLPLEVFNEGLNPSQRAAVQFALSAEDVALIHGPPGTGKTTTLVELIRQCVARGERVLACAPSNMGVDNLLAKLLASGVSAVRLGHPARVLPELREHTLDALVEKHDDVRLAHKLVRDALALRRKAGRYTRAKPEPGAKADMRREAGQLFADARRLERQAVAQVLDGHFVICGTTTGLHDDLLGDREFDLVVIDEAAQSTEPPCWIPLPRSRRLVLAGDPFQLPPTVVSTEAAAQGYGVSLMERLLSAHGEGLSRMLTVQYRMHQSIAGFSSQQFYGGGLEADSSVAGHLLCNLPGVRSEPLTQTPLDFIDTAGASYDESQDPDGESRSNTAEERLACSKVRQLLDCGLAPREIALVAPYGAQVRLLEQLLDNPEVEIDSVDGFQGREKEAVVISLVRSNTRGEIGFLADTRRMNVALTRARRKLIVIGDSATLGGHPFYRDLLDYLDRVGGYHTVWEEAEA